MKICRENSYWVKSARNIGHFMWRPKYVLLLPATLNRHKGCLHLRLCRAVSPSFWPSVHLSACVSAALRDI
jgi:hypothetical protein